MGQQVHHQHQHRDELLASALDQPGRDDGSADGAGVGSVSYRCAHRARDVRRRRVGGASQHGSLARHRADRRAAIWTVADRRRVADATPVGSLRIHWRSRLPGAHLSADQGRGAVLPRHARRGAVASLAHHLAVAVARESAPVRNVTQRRPGDGRGDPARAVRQRDQGRWCARRRRRAAAEVECNAGQACAAADRHRRSVAGVARRLGHAGARDPPPSRVAPVRLVSRSRHRRAPHARTGSGRETLARDSRRSGDRLGDGVADQSLGQAGRWQSRLRHPEVPARSGADVSEHVRCAPAVSDRRQLRRHFRHRRDAAAG